MITQIALAGLVLVMFLSINVTNSTSDCPTGDQMDLLY